MQSSHEMLLVKVIVWSIENDIEMTVKTENPGEGLAKMIEIIFKKNGKTSSVKFMDFLEMQRPAVLELIKMAAFDLCLTRLEL